MGLSKWLGRIDLWPDDLLFAFFSICMDELQRRYPEAYQEAAAALPTPGPKMKEMAKAMDDAILAATPTKGKA